MFVSDLFNAVLNIWCLSGLFAGNQRWEGTHQGKEQFLVTFYRHKQLNHEGVIYLLLMRGAGL